MSYKLPYRNIKGTMKSLAKYKNTLKKTPENAQKTFTELKKVKITMPKRSIYAKPIVPKIRNPFKKSIYD